MDVSSKYFSQLTHPSQHSIKYLWNFWLDIRRVGKVRELFSFVLWEVIHKLYVYKISNKYVRFTNDPFLTITGETVCTLTTIIPSSFLARQGLCLQPVAVDWKYCVETAEGRLWGCCYSDLHTLRTSYDQSQSAVPVYTFDHPITSLFISRTNILFVCTGGVIYRSDKQGESFKKVLQLSSPISYFLFNNGMTELPDQTLLIGEYGSIWHGNTWQNLAFLYYSTDGGNTWQTSDFLMRQGVNKHIHLVKYCPLLKSVLLTDGDNKKQVWTNNALSHFNKEDDGRGGGWHLINKYHHQTGGYTSMAETDEAVLFGSDYLGGTNFIVKTQDGKRFSKLVLPDPYRRSPVMNMAVRHSSSGSDVWATSYSCLSGEAKSLLMCTSDSGKTWARVIEFDGRTHEVRLATSSQHKSDTVYLSVTEFGNHQSQPRHWVYKVSSIAQ